MKLKSLIAACCFGFFSIAGHAQEAEPVLNSVTGEIMLAHNGLFSNGTDLIAIEVDTYNRVEKIFYVDENQNTIELSLPSTGYKLPDYSWNSDGWIFGKSHLIHNQHIYFTLYKNGIDLFRFNAETKDLEQLTNDQNLGAEFIHSTDDKIYLNYNGDLSSKEGFIASYDVNSGALSVFGEDTLLAFNGNTIPFKNSWITGIRNDNSFYLNQGGIAVYHSDTDPNWVPLLPGDFYDTIPNEDHFYNFCYQPTTNDTLIFFLNKYGSLNYHEVALYMSKGNANDAVKVKTLYKQYFLDNGGEITMNVDYIMPQNFVWYKGHLYFYAYGEDRVTRHLYRTTKDGLDAERVTQINLTANGGQLNGFLCTINEHMYFLGSPDENPDQYDNNLYRLNLETQELEEVYSGNNLFNGLIKIDDKRLLVYTKTDPFFGKNVDFLILDLENNKTQLIHTGYEGKLTQKNQANIANNRLFFSGFTGNEMALYATPQFATSTNINELNMESDLVLFPNPADDSFQIVFSSNDDKIQAVKIFNGNGSEVMGLNNHIGNIDVSHLASGIYFAKISTEAGYSTTKKLVIH
ncbi:T9SS type A sorting domain-containing protein [Luteibaculum oceani]|uniref:T9SS type A sorting domain-containing protein n=1 Tax=Luteibaculum oceani TaxID=1294296 RepID=A0A5C6VKL6_9FLAO|nr:T9SS type A sorting domain-containing protein [Luteibaculum oceani]TXC85224.1 T9SS type A sorting domain-containing protein [Luteibaculum oceani]